MPDYDDIDQTKLFLGLNESEPTLEPIPFTSNDPLGSSSVLKSGKISVNRQVPHNRSIGDQVASLTTSLDRIMALKHLTTSIHISLTRSIILKLLSLLSITTNYLTLMNRLELMGLSDIRKVVRLMVLTAMDRVEIANINLEEFPNNVLHDFTHFATRLSPEANACLHYLSISIAALTHNNLKASNLVVKMCMKDLIMSARGVPVPKAALAVTQALVNTFSGHGGILFLDLPKDEIPSSPLTDPNSLEHLSLVNSLSFFILSSHVHHEDKEWAAQQLFKSIASKMQMLSCANSEHINYADLTSFLPKGKIEFVAGHDNRIASLAWHEKTNKLASCGYDGTIRLWIFESKTQLTLDTTLVFHQSVDIFGHELHGKLISHLKWSPTGAYIVAVIDSVINIWSLKKSELNGAYSDCFIEDQKEVITALAWSRSLENTESEQEFLIVGKIDGSVTLIGVKDGKVEVETIVNCSLTYGEYIIFLEIRKSLFNGKLMF